MKHHWKGLWKTGYFLELCTPIKRANNFMLLLSIIQSISLTLLYNSKLSPCFSFACLNSEKNCHAGGQHISVETSNEWLCFNDLSTTMCSISLRCLNCVGEHNFIYLKQFIKTIHSCGKVIWWLRILSCQMTQPCFSHSFYFLFTTNS